MGSNKWSDVRQARPPACVAAVGLLVLVGCLLTGLEGGAHAQSTAQPTANADAESGNALTDIVVTAQKREEAAQKVPIALSVVTSATIRDSGATSIEDLQKLVPSLQIIGENGPGNYTVTARGIANLVSTAESSSVVGLYLDETPVSAFGDLLPDVGLFDVARVEFLRGPQGTLYGEGSEAGTLRLVSNAPDSHKFSGSFDSQAGSIDRGGSAWNAQGALNIPLIDNELALRLSGSYSRNTGWINVPDLHDPDANWFESGGGRAVLRWTPIEQLTLDVSWLHQRFDADTTTLQTTPEIFRPSDVNPLAGPVRQLSPYRYDYDVGNLTVRYDLDFASIVSSSSYFRQAGPSFSDLSPYFPIYTGLAFPGTGQEIERDRSRLYSEELRIASDGQQVIDWTAGVFLRHLTRNEAQKLTLDALPAPGTEISLLDQSATERATDNSVALFGQGTWHITPEIAATAGLRYYEDWRRQDSDLGSGPLLIKGGANAWTPNFVLEWFPVDTVNLYAKAARGFRTGGENPFHALSPALVPAQFQPESLWSYEFGAKTRIVTWLTANAYLFYEDWSNLQLSLSNGVFGYTGTAGHARSKGFELEVNATPLPGLDVSGDLTLTDSLITKGGGSLAVNPPAFTPLVPHTEIGLHVEYRHPLLDEVDGFVRADYQYRGQTFSEPLNVNFLANPDSSIVNLRTGIQWRDYRFDVFVNNAGNEDASEYRSVFLYPTSVTVPSLQVVSQRPPQPRTIGIELSARF